MDTRRLVVFEALNKLGWCDYMPSKDIKTLHGEKVGDIKINLPFQVNIVTKNKYVGKILFYKSYITITSTKKGYI